MIPYIALQMDATGVASVTQGNDQSVTSTICRTVDPVHNLSTTFEAVDRRLTFRNGEVIDKAFRDASIQCSHCSYPENAGDFNWWLGHHISDKLYLHRATRMREFHFQICSDPTWRGWKRAQCGQCNEQSSNVFRLEREAKSSREELKEIWPCVDCIARYNPTSRINHILRNKPELKGFLDVRFD